MDKSKIRVIVITVFLLVISALVLNFVKDTGVFTMDTPKAIGPKVNVDLVTVKTIGTEVRKNPKDLTNYVNYINTKANKLSVSKLRDPFILKKKPAPVVTTEVAKKTQKKKRPEINISGIVWDKKNPYALINGEIYEIGDNLSGYTVHTILDSMIVLSNEHDIYTIEFTREKYSDDDEDDK